MRGRFDLHGLQTQQRCLGLGIPSEGTFKIGRKQTFPKPLFITPFGLRSKRDRDFFLNLRGWLCV